MFSTQYSLAAQVRSRSCFVPLKVESCHKVLPKYGQLLRECCILGPFVAVLPGIAPMATAMEKR
jgi:hypothetical protein